MHPKQPQFADVANLSPSKCYDGPLIGRSSFLIKDDSSARIEIIMILPKDYILQLKMFVIVNNFGYMKFLKLVKNA
ncbi:hypothetical protein CEXT_627531 [Caerostris extrusa]|uniref:Uncharacterized protein n=1 Tax=Caerostris extrusa TaxID=172846 RepID=A0AAV4YA16_CAEEX|nr:hypothetical protein CEXT_627531 [Caerostris extrusa]